MTAKAAADAPLHQRPKLSDAAARTKAQGDQADEPRVGRAAMRCSINIPNLGDFADPRRVADVARLAEEAGWDGLFIWDHLIGYNRDLVGEFAATNILLTAAALATERIRLGTQVTPVPRRRPRQLAREIATLDR